MTFQVSQNFHPECEAAVSQLVNLELFASYVYLSMALHFDREDVALSHVAQFFREQFQEEREHADKFLRYQNQRGGRIVLEDIKKPDQDEWDNSLDAMQEALQLEKQVNQALLDLHSLATEKADPHLCNFLESEYLEEQVKAIKRLVDHITNLKHLGVPQNSMGEYLFDKLTLGGEQDRSAAFLRLRPPAAATPRRHAVHTESMLTAAVITAAAAAAVFNRPFRRIWKPYSTEKDVVYILLLTSR
ncbi:PREDICTED: ferritin heavy chain B-like [Gekko japonicus]|uniref:Ferritin n=1 Tax=Gekko japonicus TaxID=146911 RepID=A0ABM1KP66_GEKJA|nr:PREDICTED: ferritin heavy chain B-like [Gekko japonicus]